MTHIHSVITSYGEGHHDTPHGDALRVDTRPLRNPPDDPATRDRMLHLTGLDPEVRTYVLATPGAQQLIDRNVQRALTLLRTPHQAGTQHHRVDIHVTCAGGRHRSVAIAEEIAARLRAAGYGIEVEHAHVHRPVLAPAP
ncbi:RapZ C-terminal domain-containing protein [Streptomyces huasconensis]|uniref:RapZ C-terminal domain-containing protein n=1 Tax=Streptomyces huasconensis TaxID=1854574 RepID=UPI0036FF46EC